MDVEKTEKIKELASLIKRSGSTVFFGGAGVSTESGVKDYRSEDGLYKTVKEYGVSPEVILSHDFLCEHPDIFYDFYYKFFLQSAPLPNMAHKVLAMLEERGMLDAVITQNIDGLHQSAGSKKVYELHGTTERYYCNKCGAPFSRCDVVRLKGKVPHCALCGGIVRPEVVLYGEGLSDATVRGAVGAISSCELLIIGGTSLAVYPAAGFIEYFRGQSIVLINMQETPYDSYASLIFRDKIGEVFSEVIKLI